MLAPLTKRLEQICKSRWYGIIRLLHGRRPLVKVLGCLTAVGGYKHIDPEVHSNVAGMALVPWLDLSLEDVAL